jgi:hypothetical protein
MMDILSPSEVEKFMAVLGNCDRLQELEFHEFKHRPIQQAEIWHKISLLPALRKLSFAPRDAPAISSASPIFKALQALTIQRFDRGSQVDLEILLGSDKRLAEKITELECRFQHPTLLFSQLPFIRKTFSRLHSLVLYLPRHFSYDPSEDNMWRSTTAPFVGLTSFRITSPLTIFSDHDIIPLAKLLPDVETIEVEGALQSQVTFHGVLAVVQICRRLHTLRCDWQFDTVKESDMATITLPNNVFSTLGRTRGDNLFAADLGLFADLLKCVAPNIKRVSYVWCQRPGTKELWDTVREILWDVDHANGYNFG